MHNKAVIKIGKLQIVDLTRSFAIVAVMFIHLRPGLYLPQEEWARFLLDHFSRNGVYGVSIFFVVSGFLITGVLDNGSKGLFQPDIKNFYIQRAGRILPLLILTVIFGVILVQTIQGSFEKFNYCFIKPEARLTLGYWLSLITFTYNWYFLFCLRSLGIHFQVLWSLSVEEQFYFVYPFILKKIKNKNNFIRFLFFTLFLSLLWRIGIHYLLPNDYEWEFKSSFAAFDQLAFGVLLYLAHKKYFNYLSVNKKFCAGICLAGFLIIGWIYFGISYKDPFKIIYGPTFLSVGVSAFLLGGIHLPFFESKLFYILSLPGKYCYGNYLLHTSIIYYFYDFLMKFNALTSCAVFVVLTTLFAAISYHFFEMPMNHLIRRTFGAERGKG